MAALSQSSLKCNHLEITCLDADSDTVGPVRFFMSNKPPDAAVAPQSLQRLKNMNIQAKHIQWLCWMSEWMNAKAIISSKQLLSLLFSLYLLCPLQHILLTGISLNFPSPGINLRSQPGYMNWLPSIFLAFYTSLLYSHLKAPTTLVANESFKLQCSFLPLWPLHRPFSLCPSNSFSYLYIM